MFRILQKIVCSLCGGVVLWLAFLGCSSLRPPKAMGQGLPDVRPALPVKAELVGFDKYEFHAYGRGKSVWAYRVADGLTFNISLSVAPTEAEAEKVIRDVVFHWHQVAMLPGTPSNHKIGQEAWHSYRNGADTMDIVARDGRSIVTVMLALSVPKDAHGKPILVHGGPVRGHLSQAHLLLAENHVLKALDKLTAMGYTSRSTNATKKASRH